MSTLMCAALLTSTSNAALQMMKSCLSWFQKFKSTATQPHAGGMESHYPHPPSPETVIARQSTATTYPEKLAEQAVKALAAVCKVLNDRDTPENISINGLLFKSRDIM